MSSSRRAQGNGSLCAVSGRRGRLRLSVPGTRARIHAPAPVPRTAATRMRHSTPKTHLFPELARDRCDRRRATSPAQPAIGRQSLPTLTGPFPLPKTTARETERDTHRERHTQRERVNGAAAVSGETPPPRKKRKESIEFHRPKIPSRTTCEMLNPRRETM